MSPLLINIPLEYALEMCNCTIVESYLMGSDLKGSDNAAKLQRLLNSLTANSSTFEMRLQRSIASCVYMTGLTATT